MLAESRTANSLKNSIVALCFYFLNLVLQFFSRKIFLDNLGTEILGLNTTATNLLQFLNLAELGIGSAIACTLYKPLSAKDTKTINEIISLQGWMYRRIAWIVIIGAIILICFFPWIFVKLRLPIWYAYASFGVLLFSALLGYFVNYKQIILSADQKDYKIQYSYRTAIFAKIICQILAVKYLNNGYVWWLVLEALFAIIASIVLNIVIRRTYPYLRTDLSVGNHLRQQYPEIITKIKQLFFHKIGSFALTQTSSIIIYAYASLTLVALYGNYMMIITGVTVLCSSVFSSMHAAVGNLVADGNNNRIIDIFTELFSVRFWLSCTICFGVYILTPAFIAQWLGPEYILDNVTLGLLVATLYIGLTRSTVDAFINAYGLFNDIWAPVCEAVINIGMSILLGAFWGLHGILTGVLISLFIVVFCWKPYFLFKKGLKKRLNVYTALYCRHIAILIVVASASFFILKYLSFDFAYSVNALIGYGCIAVGGFSILLFIGLYIFEKSIRNFVKRCFRIIK